MKILITGASSFTGSFFVESLFNSGHEIHAVFTKGIKDYENLRSIRIDRIKNKCTQYWNCSFGDQKFLDIIDHQFDIYCHHGTYMEDYRSLDYNLVKSVDHNYKNIKKVFTKLKSQSVKKIIFSGSVFEKNEGFGTEPLRAFSPYGLSKGISSDIIEFWCNWAGIDFCKFIIPNPFGPLEEFKYTRYLMETWAKNEIAEVKTPKYIRDNIHVKILAEEYKNFIISDLAKCNPSGYVESQLDFTSRFAKEISSRISLPCTFREVDQKIFDEPLSRSNGKLTKSYFHPLEEKCWDDIALRYFQ